MPKKNKFHLYVKVVQGSNCCSCEIPKRILTFFALRIHRGGFYSEVIRKILFYNRCDKLRLLNNVQRMLEKQQKMRQGRKDTQQMRITMSTFEL